MKKIGMYLSIIMVITLGITMTCIGCKGAEEVAEAVEEAAEETAEEAGEVPGITPGTEVVVYLDGGINSEPFKIPIEGKSAIDRIREESGIEVVLSEVAEADVYSKLKNEFVAGTGAFDLVIYSPYLVPEFANLGNLMSMEEYLNVRDPKLDDIIESLRELYCTYNGEIYALPYDGDLHVYYYRKDLIENEEEKANFEAEYGYELAAPQTWEQAHDYAEFFTRDAGETLAGEVLDSKFYGNGMLMSRGWSRYEFMDHFIAYGGQYFDEDLNPLINSEAGVKAIEDLMAMSEFAPDGILAWGYSENRGAFLSGETASMILWTGTFKFSFNEDESSIPGKVGLTHIPGSMRDGELYYKSTMPFGRVMSLTATTEVPAEAFWVASYMSEFASKYFCADPRTGEDPFRYTHVDDPDFLAATLTEFSNTEVPVEDCAIYFDAVKKGFQNGYPDLSIPGANQYMDLLDLNIQRALTGEVTPQVALDTIVDEWNDLSDTLGFDNQKAIWQAQVSTWKKLGLIQ